MRKLITLAIVALCLSFAANSASAQSAKQTERLQARLAATMKQQVYAAKVGSIIMFHDGTAFRVEAVAPMILRAVGQPDCRTLAIIEERVPEFYTLIRMVVPPVGG